MSVVNKEIIRDLEEKAKALKSRIVLPEALEPRILKAASIANSESLAHVILLGKKEQINNKARELSLDIEGIEILDFENDDRLKAYIDGFYALRKHKGMTIEDAKKILENPVYFAGMMVKSRHADGFVAGAGFTTRDVAKAAIQCIGVKKGLQTVSSAFIILLPLGQDSLRLFIFADCGIVPEPSARQLVDIAKSASELLVELFDITPRVAMLSYSTKGSGRGASVDKVREATDVLKKEEPSLLVDGEIQADAAVNEGVCRIKSADSPIGGDANILIFPNLDSGNIAYKLVQRLTGANALGPFLMGLNFPASDLSRGCSAQDIVDIISITSLRCKCQRF